MLDKTEMLFIRACKSLDPKKRLMSVYRRLYLGGITEEFAILYISSLLADIVQRYKLIDLDTLIHNLSPNSFDYKQYSYNEKVFYTLINAIRFAEYKKFPRLIKPLRYRNEN